MSKRNTTSRADVARTLLNTAKGTEAIARDRDDRARAAADIVLNPSGDEVDHMTLHARTEAAAVASLMLTMSAAEVSATRKGEPIAEASKTRATFNGGCVDALGPVYPTKTGAVPTKLPKGGAIRNIVNVAHYVATAMHAEAAEALGLTRSGKRSGQYEVPTAGIAEGIEALAEVLMDSDWGQPEGERATRTRRVRAIRPAADPVDTLRRAIEQAAAAGIERPTIEALTSAVYGPSEAEAFAEAIEAAEAEVAEVA